MKRLQSFACLLVGLLAVTALPCKAKPMPNVNLPSLTLTRAGKPAATIVLSGKPTRAAAFAAAELQDHVKRITGARLPIVSDTADVTGARILVGESAATRKLGLTSASFRSGEYLVRIRPGLVVLMGRDKQEAAQASDPDPTFVPGKFGQALNFDGVKNMLALPHSGFSDAEGTWEAWVWLPEKLSPQSGTLLRMDSVPWTYHILGVDANSRQIYYRVYDGKAVAILESPTLSFGWHHVVATHSVKSGKIELFIDNASLGTAPYVQTQCKSAVLYIGAAPGAGGAAANAFTGKIDEVRVSRVARAVPGDASGGPYKPDKDTTLLLHCDDDNSAGMAAHDRVDTAQAPDFFDERETLSAVYDVLERDCGVRWYAPTEVGMVYPRKATLTIAARDTRRAPAMSYLWMVDTPLFMPTPQETIPARDVQLWKLRMRLGEAVPNHTPQPGEGFIANHSFYGFEARFKKTHPDWFSGDQMCYTNPGFIGQVAEDADGYFDGKGVPPGSWGIGNFYALVPMDNGNYGPCAQGLLDPTTNTQFFNNRASNYVWGFVNKVAEQVGKSHPDKYLSALAYWEYTYPPSNVTLAPNIAVELCLPMRDECYPAVKANNRKVFRLWTQGQGKRPFFMWLYYNFPGMNGTVSHFNNFPGTYAHAIVQQMKLYHQGGIRGIFLEHSSEFHQSYLQDQLEFYVTLRLADDPTLNGDALIDEFFTRYYGAASEPMRQLYDGMEAVYSDPKNYPKSAGAQTEEIAWGSLGTPPRMARWGQLMTQAIALAKTPAEKTRVAYYKRGIWDFMVAGQKAYAAKAALFPGRDTLRAAAPPALTVPRIAAIANGDPNAVNWSLAAPLAPWHTLMGFPTSHPINGAIAHDNTYLYVQLVDQVLPANLDSEPGIYTGDDWEIFVAPTRGKEYRQFAVNPVGASFDNPAGEGAYSWVKTSGAHIVSTSSRTDGWRVRFAIPLATVLPHPLKSGDHFFANFYRGSQKNELLAWSPNFVLSFHDTSRMGDFTLE